MKQQKLKLSDFTIISKNPQTDINDIPVQLYFNNIEGNIHIPKLTDKLKNIGIDIGMYVSFAINDNGLLFIIPTKKNIKEKDTYKISKTNKNNSRCSIKGNYILSTIGFKAQPPKKEGNKSSMVHINGKIMTIGGITGLMLDVSKYI